MGPKSVAAVFRISTTLKDKPADELARIATAVLKSNLTHVFELEGHTLKLIPIELKTPEKDTQHNNEILTESIKHKFSDFAKNGLNRGYFDRQEWMDLVAQVMPVLGEPPINLPDELTLPLLAYDYRRFQQMYDFLNALQNQWLEPKQYYFFSKEFTSPWSTLSDGGWNSEVEFVVGKVDASLTEKWTFEKISGEKQSVDLLSITSSTPKEHPWNEFFHGFNDLYGHISLFPTLMTDTLSHQLLKAKPAWLFKESGTGGNPILQQAAAWAHKGWGNVLSPDRVTQSETDYTRVINLTMYALRQLGMDSFRTAKPPMQALYIEQTNPKSSGTLAPVHRIIRRGSPLDGFMSDLNSDSIGPAVWRKNDQAELSGTVMGFLNNIRYSDNPSGALAQVFAPYFSESGKNQTILFQDKKIGLLLLAKHLGLVQQATMNVLDNQSLCLKMMEDLSKELLALEDGNLRQLAEAVLEENYTTLVELDLPAKSFRLKALPPTSSTVIKGTAALVVTIGLGLWVAVQHYVTPEGTQLANIGTGIQGALIMGIVIPDLIRRFYAYSQHQFSLLRPSFVKIRAAA